MPENTANVVPMPDTPPNQSASLAGATIGSREAEADASEATPVKPQAFAWQPVDEEFDLRHDLVALSNSVNMDIKVIEEKLYFLRKVMVGTGREGLFTPFLRDEMGWTGERPDNKARRWIARYELRNDLITKEKYDKIMGNGGGGVTSRNSSGTAGQTRSTSATLTKDFIVETEEEALDIEAPLFTCSELLAAEAQLNDRAPNFLKVVFRRVLLTTGQAKFWESALNTQARRYGTRTYKDTMQKILFCGLKKAEEDDEWGQALDEIYEEIGHNPSLADEPEQPDRDDDEVFLEATNDDEEDILHSSADASVLADLHEKQDDEEEDEDDEEENDAEEEEPYFRDYTLDLFYTGSPNYNPAIFNIGHEEQSFLDEELFALHAAS